MNSNEPSNYKLPQSTPDEKAQNEFSRKIKLAIRKAALAAYNNNGNAMLWVTLEDEICAACEDIRKR